MCHKNYKGTFFKCNTRHKSRNYQPQAYPQTVKVTKNSINIPQYLYFFAAIVTNFTCNSYHSSANQSSDNRKIIGRSTSSVKTAAVCSVVSGNAEVRKTAEAFKGYAKTKQPVTACPKKKKGKGFGYGR